MLRIVFFVFMSAGIFYYSWPSLSDPRSHGFYRFFAFEAILILFLLNVSHWFDNILAVHQIISWILLASSLILVIHGLHLLRKIGEPEDSIEATTVLVRQGAYKYIRHPLYSSLLLLAWGIFFKEPSFWGGLLTMIATSALVATAKVEEEENLEKFGQAYADNMKTTKRFIPFLY